MRLVLIVLFLSGCIYRIENEPCPVCEPMVLDCDEQIREHKIITIELLDECRAKLRKYSGEEDSELKDDYPYEVTQ